MSDGICSIDDCTKAVFARGWCGMHYERWRRRGSPHDHGSVIFGDDERRFWSYVDKTDSCWLWTAALNPDGYGKFRVNGRTMSAHRFAYEMLVAPIPEKVDGQRATIDHLCRVRHCVNPDHLEMVADAENILRGHGPAAINARKTHCVHGHPFNETNTYVNQGKRFCRVCARDAQRRYRARIDVTSAEVTADFPA